MPSQSLNPMKVLAVSLVALTGIAMLAVANHGWGVLVPRHHCGVSDFYAANLVSNATGAADIMGSNCPYAAHVKLRLNVLDKTNRVLHSDEQIMQVPAQTLSPLTLSMHTPIPGADHMRVDVLDVED